MAVAASVVALSLTACAARGEVGDADGAWVGTITSEGNVTTVVNEAGSVWGGTARLVEELSIGVESGEPEYMLGPARSVWDTGDRLFYPDVSVPVVRVYDGAGIYLGSVGRAGQGPGEYQYPFSVLTLVDGRIVVSNANSDWIDLFSSEPDFRFVQRWGPYTEQLDSGGRLFNRLTLGSDGTLYTAYREMRQDSDTGLYDLYHGWRSIDAEGVGEPTWRPQPEYDELRTCVEPDCSRYLSVPFAPLPSASFTPDAVVVAGVGDDYRFEMLHLDGSVTIVRRTWDPVALSDEEWAYWRQRQRAEALMRNAGWQRSWGDDVPRSKPAFSSLHAARDGRILVVREGPSRRVESCTENPQPEDTDFEPCWESTQIWELFDADGRYLGEIEHSGGLMRTYPDIDGDRFTMAVEDEVGTIMVKRYRLVLPGQDGH